MNDCQYFLENVEKNLKVKNKPMITADIHVIEEDKDENLIYIEEADERNIPNEGSV